MFSPGVVDLVLHNKWTTKYDMVDNKLDKVAPYLDLARLTHNPGPRVMISERRILA